MLNPVFPEGTFLRSACILLAILCALPSLVEGRPTTLEKCGKRYAPLRKILGGEWAMPGEYPWMVSVHEDYGYGFDHICGGAIVNEYYILTAAHCIDYPKNASRYEIYVGLHRLSKNHKKPARMYKISKLTLHENYNPETFENDMALMRTAEPIEFEDTAGYVNGICLPDSDKDPTGWAIVTGWGHTEEGGDISDVLLAAKVPLIPRDLCVKSYHDNLENPTEVLDTQICAGTTNRDSCQNDSGGPLIQRDDDDGVYRLIGVVSYGVGCGDRHYPGVYQKVAAYMDWIEKHMEMESEEKDPAPPSGNPATLTKLLWYSKIFK